MVKYKVTKDLIRKFIVTEIQEHNTYFLTKWIEDYTFSNIMIGKSIGR